MEHLDWHLGDVVAKIRAKRGWTQTELGRRAKGLSKATIVRLERRGGAGTNTDTIHRVADALGVDVKDLYALIPADHA